MKNKYIKVFMLLGLVFILAACSSGNSTTPGNDNQSSQGSNNQSSSNDTGDQSEVAEDRSPIQTNIIGGRVGGAWSVFTEGVAESIRRSYEGSIVTVEPGGLTQNAPAVGDGTMDYGLVMSLTAWQAYQGIEPYEGTAFEDLRAVSVVIPTNAYHIIAREGANFNSMEEIIENKLPVRMVLDSKGALAEIMFRNILETYGVTYDDIIAWGGSIDHLGNDKAYELMRDNRADLSADAFPFPDGGTIEAASTMSLKFVTMEDQYIEKVANDFGLLTATIPAGTYDFQDEDIFTVSTPTILVTNKNKPDEEVYKVAKAIYENLDYLGNVHNELKKLTTDNLAEVGDLPLHPGAEKFFKEVGIIQ